MRISDWSSDVCSSDRQPAIPDRCGRLSGGAGKDARLAAAPFRQATQGEQARGRGARTRPAHAATHAGDHSTRGGGSRSQARRLADRQSVVEGKSVSIRVDLGGGRIIKKKKKSQ